MAVWTSSPLLELRVCDPHFFSNRQKPKRKRSGKNPKENLFSKMSEKDILVLLFLVSIVIVARSIIRNPRNRSGSKLPSKPPNKMGDSSVHTHTHKRKINSFYFKMFLGIVLDKRKIRTENILFGLFIQRHNCTLSIVGRTPTMAMWTSAPVPFTRRAHPAPPSPLIGRPA
jgi:hypothetical protein